MVLEYIQKTRKNMIFFLVFLGLNFILKRRRVALTSLPSSVSMSLNPSVSCRRDSLRDIEKPAVSSLRWFLDKSFGLCSQNFAPFTTASCQYATTVFS